jgi:hypothetical protein
MRHPAKFVFSLALLLPLMPSSCHKQPLQLPAPEFNHPPDISAMAPSLPLALIETPPTPEPLPPTLDAGKAVHSRPHPRRSAAGRPPTGSEPPGDEPAPAPAPPPAAPPAESVQITAAVPPAAANDQRRNTEQMLQTTENTLRRVTRGLTESEKAMMQQAQSYITQARAAIHDGDLERAYNLAVKANLLATALAK